MNPVQIHRQLPLDIEECVLRLRNYHRFSPNSFYIRNHIIVNRHNRQSCEFQIRRSCISHAHIRKPQNRIFKIQGVSYVQLKLKGTLIAKDDQVTLLDAHISHGFLTYPINTLILLSFIRLFLSFFIHIGPQYANVQGIALLGFIFLLIYLDLLFRSLPFTAQEYAYGLRNDVNALFSARPDLMKLKRYANSAQNQTPAQK
jgi:hypothetical protein